MSLFKFGGGEQIKSSEKITLPCWLARVKCLIQTDVVNSDIPLLLSKTAMKKAKMELDLVHEKAKISGKEVPLQNTSSGHYIGSLKEILIPIEQSLIISDCQKVLDKLQETCDVCLKFKRTLSRPVVSLPLATNFNEVVVIDHKEWVKGKIWFLTRFSLSAVIYNKHPATVINKVMLLWIGSGFGAPCKFLADNGSEFGNDEF